jgi:cytochrome c-type biogenesis protein
VFLAVSADPASGVGIFTALAAGIVSFLSPCVLPLVPGYLSAVTGVAAADLERADWRRVIVPSLLFVSSFSVIFILLGLTATGIGSTLQEHQLVRNKIAGWLIIAMGVFFIAALFIPQLNREWHVEGLLARAGTGGPLVAGAAFAFAWTPCVGPTLGSILTAASVSDTVAKGGILLLFYSLGLAVPFLLTAVAFTRATSAFRWLRDRYLIVTAVSGAILITMGVLLFTGELSQLNIEAQQALDSVGLNIFGDL